MSRDKSSGSVLGPQGKSERLLSMKEIENDLKFSFPPEKVVCGGNEASNAKDTGKKCVVCGGAIVEDVWYESSVMTRVGSHDRGHRRSMRYCQNCEILYK